jgi:hypothetical protein
MCDDAENLAGAGTDVRRCSDALGPRKTFRGMLMKMHTYEKPPCERSAHGRPAYEAHP